MDVFKDVYNILYFSKVKLGPCFSFLSKTPFFFFFKQIKIQIQDIHYTPSLLISGFLELLVPLLGFLKKRHILMKLSFATGLQICPSGWTQ